MTNVIEEIELHVITPDEPGIFGRVLATLANIGVNVKAISAYTDETGGHFLLVTSDPVKAQKALKSLGYKVKTHKVITVLVSDRIGAGAEIGFLLGSAVIDIRHSYCSTAGGEKILIVFRTSNNKKALSTLK